MCVCLVTAIHGVPVFRAMAAASFAALPPQALLSTFLLSALSKWNCHKSTFKKVILKVFAFLNFQKTNVTESY